MKWGGPGIVFRRGIFSGTTYEESIDFVEKGRREIVSTGHIHDVELLPGKTTPFDKTALFLALHSWSTSGLNQQYLDLRRSEWRGHHRFVTTPPSSMEEGRSGWLGVTRIFNLLNAGGQKMLNWDEGRRGRRLKRS